MSSDTPDASAALEHQGFAIASVMEEHAPTAARALPVSFIGLVRRFLVLRRAGADIIALANGALALTRKFRTSDN